MSVESPSAATVVVPSRFSSEQLPDFEKEVEARLQDGTSLLQLDCSVIEYATSSHINALWLALRMCQAHEVVLRLQSPTAQLLRVLQVMDLYDVFAQSGLGEITPKQSVQAPAAGQAYDLEFGADLDSLRGALKKFLGWIGKLELPDVDEVELQTVFYEAAANIIEHGGLAEGMMIRFQALTTEDSLKMTFFDGGIEFDTAAHAAAIDYESAARSAQTRGYGLAMIRQLVDNIEYQRVDNSRNELNLTRKWQRQS